MRINNNIMAMNTYRQLGAASSSASKSMEKLSSGLKINKAGDDAAGLAISEKMRSQIRGLNQASRNAQDGISLIQTAEGALNEVHSILQRIRELAVQANNGTNTAEDKEKIQAEIEQLRTEITDIANRTEFNGRNLLDGSLGATAGTIGTDISLVFKIIDVTGSAVGTYTLKVVQAVAADPGDSGGETPVPPTPGSPATITLTNPDGSLAQTLMLVGNDAENQVEGTRYNFDKLGVVLEVVGTDPATIENDIDISGIDGAVTDSQFAVTASGIKFQIGANANQELPVSIANMQAGQLGTAGLKIDAIDVTDDAQDFADRLDAIDAALTQVSQERAKLGAYQNRLEHTITNLDTSSENLQAAESRIRDVDMAKEMMEFTKNNILQQAATAMLAQANQAPQGILQLLR
jgi:flagellin